MGTKIILEVPGKSLAFPTDGWIYNRFYGFKTTLEEAEMAKDPGIGFKITATVIGVKGTCGACHQKGESFGISCHDSGGLCGFFYHDLFPDLQTLQFGGNLPWWEGDEFEALCPDPMNQVTLRLRRSRPALISPL